jgi:exodeoxyribonuclease III
MSESRATVGAGLTVTTWNVNSIRARLDHVLTYLADHDPDVLCLQETKVEDRLFPRVPFMELGYEVHLHGAKALCGVATFTRREAGEVHLGFREGEPDRFPRILEVVVDGVRIYNLYCPNGTEVGSDAFDYKLRWFTRLREQLDRHHDPSEDILLVGDFNVAADERDLHDPESARGRLLFTDEERAALQNLVDFGLVDCFRQHDDQGGRYTWFDYRTGGFARNEGMRIDHVYATPRLTRRCTSVVHDPEPRGWDVPSDHLPVTATFVAET